MTVYISADEEKSAVLFNFAQGVSKLMNADLCKKVKQKQNKLQQKELEKTWCG